MRKRVFDGSGLLGLLLCLCLCAGCAAPPAEAAGIPDEPDVQQEQDVEPETQSKPESETLRANEPEPEMGAEPKPEPAPEPEPEPEPLPLEGHIICLDPGHCVTEEAGKGYREPVSHSLYLCDHVPGTVHQLFTGPVQHDHIAVRAKPRNILWINRAFKLT